MPVRASAARRGASIPAERSRPTDAGALAGEPAGARRARRSRPRGRGARDTSPEQARVGLAQALRAPDEVDVAEELAVLGLVVVGVGVPPGAARGAGLRGADDRRATAAVPSGCSALGDPGVHRRIGRHRGIPTVRMAGCASRPADDRGRVASSAHCGRRGACSQTVRPAVRRRSTVSGLTVLTHVVCSDGRRHLSTSQPDPGLTAHTSQSTSRHRSPSTLDHDHPTGVPHHMSTDPPAPPPPQVAINDIGSEEDFLAAIDRDDQVLQRWRHRRGHHRQGRPRRGPARHRLQDRGRHPLARAVHQARCRPQRGRRRSATTSRPSSSRRRTRKAV